MRNTKVSFVLDRVCLQTASFRIIINFKKVARTLNVSIRFCGSVANSGRRALDLRLEIAGSIPADALSSVDLGQVVHTHLPLSPSSIYSLVHA